MDAAEFRAARDALGLTVEQFGGELDLTPEIVRAVESGTVRVPRRLAAQLRWRTALANRERVLASSGLLECAELGRLETLLQTARGSAYRTAIAALNLHLQSCSLCAARDAFADEHAGALPDLPLPPWVRFIGSIERAINRLPAPLRPPPGNAGMGRRLGLIAGAFVSIYAFVIAILAAGAQLSNAGLSSRWWQEPARIAVGAPLGYLLGFYLAGLAFDATHRIRQSFIGYVVRGVCIVGAVYGAVGLTMPLLQGRSLAVENVTVLLAVFPAIGGIIGAVLWVVRRLRGRIPGAVE